MNYIQDPGHGWLKVSRSALLKSGIAEKITAWSFVSSSGRHVYLEEDHDAPLFIRATNLDTSKLKVSYTSKRSRIRGLDRYEHR